MRRFPPSSPLPLPSLNTGGNALLFLTFTLLRRILTGEKPLPAMHGPIIFYSRSVDEITLTRQIPFHNLYITRSRARIPLRIDWCVRTRQGLYERKRKKKEREEKKKETTIMRLDRKLARSVYPRIVVLLRFLSQFLSCANNCELPFNYSFVLKGIDFF